MAPTTSNHPPLAVRRILQKTEVRQLLAEGRHRIVTQGIARFIADVARCAGGSTRMVCLWVHFDGLDLKSNILVDLTTTKFLWDDRISQQITETETEDELLAVIDGLYESDKPQRKPKQTIETTGTEKSVDNHATKKKARKGIDKAVIRQLKRAAPVKEVDDANISLAEEAGQWTDAQMFAFDQFDKNFRDKDIEMANTAALEEKCSAENNPSISNDVEAANEHAYNENATDHTTEEESLFY